MKIWIDNTGLQSAGLCLEGRASSSHDYDVRGLLQLATLLIYSDKIYVNGFEDDRIARRSSHVVQRLNQLGAGGAIEIANISEPEYALACQTTAEIVAVDLADTFRGSALPLVAGGPPGLPAHLRARQVAAISLAQKRDNSAKLAYARESALRDRAIGAVEYMLSASGVLREAVRQAIAAQPTWGDNEAYELNLVLRTQLLRSLGEQSFAKYAPAVARGEIISANFQYVLKVLEQTTDQVTDELRGTPLGVPSTASALIARSRGEPDRLIQVAYTDQAPRRGRSVGAAGAFGTNLTLGLLVQRASIL